MAKSNKLLEKPTSFYIQGIQDQAIRVGSLPIETIEQVVEALYLEGSSTSQIAQFLGKSDRTIRRYLQGIRKKNALEPDVGLAKQLIGELLQKAMASHAYLLRLARSKEASISEKTQAEFAGWRVVKELFEKLQTAGFIALQPQQIIGDIYHHSEGGDSKTYEQLKQDLKDIEKVARETGTLDLKTEEGIKLLQQRIEKAEIVEEIVDLNKPKEGETKNQEDGHGQQ